jgi:hypothetical protein
MAIESQPTTDANLYSGATVFNKTADSATAGAWELDICIGDGTKNLHTNAATLTLTVTVAGETVGGGAASVAKDSGVLRARLSVLRFHVANGETVTAVLASNNSNDTAVNVTVVPRFVGVAQTGDSYAVVAHADYGNAKLVRSAAPGNALAVDSAGRAASDVRAIDGRKTDGTPDWADRPRLYLRCVSIHTESDYETALEIIGLGDAPAYGIEVIGTSSGIRVIGDIAADFQGASVGVQCYGGISGTGSGLYIRTNNGNGPALKITGDSDVMLAGSGTIVDSASDDVLVHAAEAAMQNNNLDHLAKTPTADADMTTELADGTILSRIIAGGDTSAFAPSVHAQTIIAADAHAARQAAEAALPAAAYTAPPTAAQIASAVWSAAERTLTGFGALVSSIWSHATRRLTGSISVTPPSAATNDMDIHRTIFKGGTRRLCACVLKNGAAVTRATLESVSYSIYMLTEGLPDRRDAVAGYAAVALNKDDVIHDELQTDAEEAGFNFAHEPPVADGGPFDTAGRRYLVEYILTPTAGQPAMVRFLVTVI